MAATSAAPIICATSPRSLYHPPFQNLQAAAYLRNQGWIRIVGSKRLYLAARTRCTRSPQTPHRLVVSTALIPALQKLATTEQSRPVTTPLPQPSRTSRRAATQLHLPNHYVNACLHTGNGDNTYIHPTTLTHTFVQLQPQLHHNKLFVVYHLRCFHNGNDDYTTPTQPR